MDNIESFQIVMARKPLQGTVADNVTTWGVGGLNVDGCRVGQREVEQFTGTRRIGTFAGETQDYKNPRFYEASTEPLPSGRWPANVILDSIAGAALDAQSGQLSKRFSESSGSKGFFGGGKAFKSYDDGDNMGASRFFYNSDTVDPIIERTNMHYQLLHGDNREQLKHLADNSIDSIVCDPPYELGFMGKRWDSTGIAYDGTVWAECLRVLKPGGHLIAFGGTRTYHRMTVAIEDAGFEIRDCIMWLYGSGFPKSLDVSKALDKQAGAEREVVGKYKATIPNITPRPSDGERYSHGNQNITAPSTDLAKQWHGWGTALKPAVEPAVLARKPLIGTVADNVTTWSVGGINIDGCRVGLSDGESAPSGGGTRGVHSLWDYSGGMFQKGKRHTGNTTPASGRWPANVILDESAGEALDEQSGISVSRRSQRGQVEIFKKENSWIGESTERGHSDSGGASRFFYTAKASKAEREAGLEGMETKLKQIYSDMGQGALPQQTPSVAQPRANHHPTVKPIALMRYLVRLVTPKGGTVLDPFMGSGSTGCAAMCEGVNFVGIELSEEYLEIARRRIEYWQSQNPMGL